METKLNGNTIVLLINKEEARHLLNALIRTNASGKDLDVSMAIEERLAQILNEK